MGHLMGLFDQPFLGIRPTRQIAMLPYCEFLRIEGGRITEVAFYFDLPSLMDQAGQNPFPPQTGAQLIQPGPQGHGGLLLDPNPAEEGEATLAAINAMITDLGQWQSGLPLEEELARTWHDDMLWWGPTGIGATFTIERYAKQHSGPFGQPLRTGPRPTISAGWPKGTSAASSAGRISPHGTWAVHGAAGQ